MCFETRSVRWVSVYTYCSFLGSITQIRSRRRTDLYEDFLFNYRQYEIFVDLQPVSTFEATLLLAVKDILLLLASSITIYFVR